MAGSSCTARSLTAVDGSGSPRRARGPWSTRASTRNGRGCARRCALSATGSSSPAGHSPKPAPTGSATRAPTSPGSTTGCGQTWPAARWRTRTWSTRRTGSRCGSGSTVPNGAISGSPTSSGIAWLDIRRGTLTRRLRWQEPDGRRTSLVQRRFVSMKDVHLAGLETTFTAENWVGQLEVWSGLDGGIVNSGVRRYRGLNGRHLDVLHTAEAEGKIIELQAETTQSHVRIAVAARTSLLVDGEHVAAERRLVTDPEAVAHALTLTLEPGRAATVEKIAALYTSRDRGISESLLEARQAAVGAPRFGDLEAQHAAEWELLWNRFGIRLDSASEWAETVLHLHVFHLLQTVSPNSIVLDVGVSARGWHGEAYRGHVFWDEMFIFPLLNVQLPTLA